MDWFPRAAAPLMIMRNDARCFVVHRSSLVMHCMIGGTSGRYVALWSDIVLKNVTGSKLGKLTNLQPNRKFEISNKVKPKIWKNGSTHGMMSC